MRKLIFIFVMTVFACAHVPKSEEVPLEADYEEIIIMAQRELDWNNYSGAKAYYQIMIDRFGSDVNVLNIGEFEIGHILIKQKKYNEAYVLLNRVLSRFEGAGSALLKSEYKKLAEIDLKKIEGKVKSSKKDAVP